MNSTLESIRNEIDLIAQVLGPAQFMEVCGTHTVTIFRSGIKSILPESIRLISGPGCPVCVTPQGYLDAAIELARRQDTIICTYGDMIRVPGSDGSLEQQKAKGSDIRVVISARDAVTVARQNPDKQVIWLGVGFETTAPTTAAAVLAAKKAGVKNFHVLNGHKLALPAMQILVDSDEVAIDGFLCPGHVSVITGSDAYKPIAAAGRVPCVIAGFEPESILKGICALMNQTLTNRADVENAYSAAVSPAGNPHAINTMYEVFKTGDTVWRALGSLPGSGLVFKDEFQVFDAATRFDVSTEADYEMNGCRCGDVIQGKVQPLECDLFGEACSPLNPIGPCMVSSEGTCAAWYKYGRNLDASRERAAKERMK